MFSIKELRKLGKTYAFLLEQYADGFSYDIVLMTDDEQDRELEEGDCFDGLSFYVTVKVKDGTEYRQPIHGEENVFPFIEEAHKAFLDYSEKTQLN